MKKTIALVLVLVLLLLPVFAGQRNYRQSDAEVQILSILSRLSDTALPDMTYPVTENNLISLLSKIDAGKLNGTALLMYQGLKDRIENKKLLMEIDSAGMDFKLPILVCEAWNDDSLLSSKDMVPIFAPYVEIKITDWLTLASEFDFRAKEDNFTEFKDIKLHSPYNATKGLSENYPTKAYGSFGNNVFNLTIGRDRLSAGGGITGNLAISENLLFQDYAKFSAMKGPLSYDFSILAYDNPVSETSGKRYDFNEKYKAAYLHRLSGVIRNKVSITFFQGLMTYGEHTFSDPRVLNPIMMIHNTFTFKNGNANNFFGIEVSAMLSHGLKLNMQGFLDQVKLGSEASGTGDNAFGVLANLSCSWPAGPGILSGYAEFVYNNPYNYLLESENSELDPGRVIEPYYTFDLISAQKFFGDNDYRQNYIGYTHGTDIRVYALGASYLWNSVKFTVDAMYRIKGCHGIGINEERRTDYEINRPEEKTLTVGAGVSGKVFEAFTYRALLGYTNSMDYQHVKGENNSNIRFAVSFSFDPMSFFVKVRNR